MNGRSFIDSNVLIYTDDGRYPEKQKAAIDLIEECRKRRLAVVSVQVLQEYFSAATRKLGVPAETARQKVKLYGRFQVMAPGVNDVLAAIDLHERYPISFWDALILRAAISTGCVRIYSEDLQHGQRIEGCEIVNPFRPQAVISD